MKCFQQCCVLEIVRPKAVSNVEKAKQKNKPHHNSFYALAVWQVGGGGEDSGTEAIGRDAHTGLVGEKGKATLGQQEPPGFFPSGCQSILRHHSSMLKLSQKVFARLHALQTISGSIQAISNQAGHIPRSAMGTGVNWCHQFRWSFLKSPNQFKGRLSFVFPRNPTFKIKTESRGKYGPGASCVLGLAEHKAEIGLVVPGKWMRRKTKAVS